MFFIETIDAGDVNLAHVVRVLPGKDNTVRLSLTNGERAIATAAAFEAAKARAVASAPSPRPARPVKPPASEGTTA